MPLLDLYEDNFPHGTDAGYDKGCRGSTACTFFASDEYFTCEEVHKQRQRPAVAALVSRWQKRPKPNVALHTPTSSAPTVNADLDLLAKDDHDEADLSSAVVPAENADTQLEAPKHTKRLELDDPDFPHGTARGYWSGCRLKDQCPGIAAGHGSCNQALAAYNKARYDAKHGKQTTGVAGSEGSGTTAPRLAEDETPEPSGHDGTADATLMPDPATPTDWHIGDRITDRYDGVGIVRALYGHTPEGKTVLGVSWIMDPHDDTPDDELTINQVINQVIVDERHHQWPQAGPTIAPPGMLWPDTVVHRTRLDLVNAEKAAREIATQDRQTIATLEETIAKQRQALTDAGAEIQRLQEDNGKFLDAADVDAQRSQETENGDLLVKAPAVPEFVSALTPDRTGGATTAHLELTINPTQNAGVALGFNLPGSGEQLAIHIQLAASNQPGLGDVAISVGSK